MLVRTSVTNQIYQIIRNHILTGEYSLGSYVNIAQICTDLGVSNTPIREALSKLESEGLLIKVGNKYRVIDICAEKNAEMDEVMKIAIVGGFELCVSKNKMQELSSALNEAFKIQSSLYNSDNYYEYVCATINFDRAVVATAGNGFLLTMFDNLSSIFTLIVSNKHRKDQMQNFEEHRSMIEAIEAGDVDRMRRLLIAHYDKPLSKYPTSM